MTEQEAIGIVKGTLEMAIAAIDAHREKFQMATDELKREVDRYKYNNSKYTCPRCGAKVFNYSLNMDYVGGDMYCLQCDATYEWKRQ